MQTTASSEHTETTTTNQTYFGVYLERGMKKEEERERQRIKQASSGGIEYLVIRSIRHHAAKCTICLHANKRRLAKEAKKNTTSIVCCLLIAKREIEHSPLSPEIRTVRLELQLSTRTFFAQTEKSNCNE